MCTCIVQITKLELACSSGWMYIVYACLALPCHAYITVDLNPADWAASVAQLAEHWTSNPVVTGSNPVRGSSVFFSLSAFGLCLTYFPSLLTFPCAYTCTRLIMYMCTCIVHVYMYCTCIVHVLYMCTCIVHVYMYCTCIVHAS